MATDATDWNLWQLQWWLKGRVLLGTVAPEAMKTTGSMRILHKYLGAHTLFGWTTLVFFCSDFFPRGVNSLLAWFKTKRTWSLWSQAYWQGWIRPFLSTYLWSCARSLTTKCMIRSLKKLVELHPVDLNEPNRDVYETCTSHSGGGFVGSKNNHLTFHKRDLSLRTFALVWWTRSRLIVTVPYPDSGSMGEWDFSSKWCGVCFRLCFVICIVLPFLSLIFQIWKPAGPEKQMSHMMTAWANSQIWSLNGTPVRRQDRSLIYGWMLQTASQVLEMVWDGTFSFPNRQVYLVLKVKVPSLRSGACATERWYFYGSFNSYGSFTITRRNKAVGFRKTTSLYLALLQGLKEPSRLVGFGIPFQQISRGIRGHWYCCWLKYG